MHRGDTSVTVPTRARYTSKSHPVRETLFAQEDCFLAQWEPAGFPNHFGAATQRSAVGAQRPNFSKDPRGVKLLSVLPKS
jgi:hypothetical protein